MSRQDSLELVAPPAFGFCDWGSASRTDVMRATRQCNKDSNSQKPAHRERNCSKAPHRRQSTPHHPTEEPRMRTIKLFVALLCYVHSNVICDTAIGQFIHPGVAHDQASIAFVKSKIESGQQPWLNAWEKLKSSRYAALDYRPEPYANVERGPYNDPNIGSSEFSDDARAAYFHSLCWVLSGNRSHADKTAEILDAWSGTLQSISNHDAKLLIGMSGFDFCIAAELLKHTWDGWTESSQERFESMLRTIWYPEIQDFYPSANGNWDASMLQTMLVMGVFLDDRAMFERAKNYYLHGEGNGSVGNYFKESGQCQESGRDQAHTQMGLDFLANSCETAWIQGIDLYGALNNRLLLGFEYTAKYNLGFDVPYQPFTSFEGRYHYRTISDNSRGRLRPMYERVYAHFQHRQNVEATFTKQAAMKLRSDQTSERNSGRSRSRSRSSNSVVETLMYAREETPPLSSDSAP